MRKCLIVLALIAWGVAWAGEAELPANAKVVLDKFEKDKRDLTEKAVVALERTLKEQMRLGDLSGANAIRREIDGLKTGGPAASAKPESEPVAISKGGGEGILGGDGIPKFPVAEWIGGSGGGEALEKAKKGKYLGGLLVRVNKGGVVAVTPIWRDPAGMNDIKGIEVRCDSATGADKVVSLVPPNGLLLVGLAGNSGRMVTGLQALYGDPDGNNHMRYHSKSEWIGAPVPDSDKVLIYADGKPFVEFCVRRGLGIDQVKLGVQ